MIDPEHLQILDAVEEQPPWTLISLCSTNDQVRHYLWLRDYWLNVRRGMLAYFAGESISEAMGGTTKENEVTRFTIDFLLDFYRLINWSWDELKASTKANLTTPGGLFEDYLNTLSKDLFLDSTRYIYFSPRRYHDANTKLEKIERQISEAKSRGDKKALKKLQPKQKIEEQKAKLRPGEANPLESSRIEMWVCAVASKSRNRQIQRHYQRFFDTGEELHKAIVRRYHPTKASQYPTVTWNKKRLTLS